MKPYYEQDGIVIYHGDCRDVLPHISGTVVTDPPYGVRDDETWDDLSRCDFAAFCMEWLPIARKASDELITFCSCYGPFRQLCELLYPRVRVAFWDKPAGSVFVSKERGLWFAHETILHCYTPVSREYVEPKDLAVGRLIRIAREEAKMSRGGVDQAIRGRKTGLCFRWEEGACLPTPDQVKALRTLLALSGEFDEALSAAYESRNDTIRRARVGASETAAQARDVFSWRTETNTSHSCQKPVGLMVELLTSLVDRSQDVIDPFMGSGTTLVAAKRLGRRAIGIEREEKHCEMAATRLAQGALKLEVAVS